MNMSCRQCRALLPGYAARELTPRQRARVARHLDECAACFVAYKEQRQLARELAWSVPRIGADVSADRLDRMRASVLGQLAQPAAQPVVRARWSSVRYSLAALLLMFALLLPVSMRAYAESVPTPPQPVRILPSGTSVVALPETNAATLTATLQANYAPPAGATDTP